MPRKSKKQPLYAADGAPVKGFNGLVGGWLDGSVEVREHKAPAQFDESRDAYDAALDALEQTDITRREAHVRLLSELTDLIQGQNLSAALGARLSAAPINAGGFRSALSQGFAKNAGENFINLIVYALADILGDQDEVLVDKGTPPPLRKLLTLRREFATPDGSSRELTIPIECDLAVWRRSDPTDAIVVSAKTRLKEVFHVGTMWKLFFDMLDDEYCQAKWGLQGPDLSSEMRYVFATADNVPKGGSKTQGGDVERDEVRNLIAMDASFFDYVFVSKSGIPHVSGALDLGSGREALFHELGCLVSMIEQQFGLPSGASGSTG
ncbi:MAG TPA: hypothetical protein VF255_01295 [Solirubrobacterales bacterium]